MRIDLIFAAYPPFPDAIGEYMACEQPCCTRKELPRGPSAHVKSRCAPSPGMIKARDFYQRVFARNAIASILRHFA
jgi:hypothetical protein